MAKKPKKPKLSAEELARIEAEKAVAAKARKLEDERKRLLAAQVEWDPRTAQGARPFHVVVGPDGSRASLDHFVTCIPRITDRTNSRLLAWGAFDAHYQKVTAGLLPPSSFEPGVDCSTTGGALVAQSRLDALKADRELKAKYLGSAHKLLVDVIHSGLTVTQAGAIPAAFRMALDRAAVFFGVADQAVAPAIRALIETTKAAQVAQPFNHAAARRLRKAGLSVRQIATHFGISYRIAYTAVGDIGAEAASKTVKDWQRGADNSNGIHRRRVARSSR